MRRATSLGLLLVVPVAVFACGGITVDVATATGQVVNPNKAASTFTLSPLTSTSGFTPNGGSVNVQTDSNTRFSDRAGMAMSASQWYDYVAMNAGPSTASMAIGKYGNGVLAASAVMLK